MVNMVGEKKGERRPRLQKEGMGSNPECIVCSTAPLHLHVPGVVVSGNAHT
jgi:hypothetical protein